MARTATPLLLGMGGLKTSGKDAFADALVEHMGFVKIMMSEHLHDCLMVLNPWIHVTPEDMARLDLREREALELDPGCPWLHYATIFEALGYDRMKVITEVRQIQQRMGTEVGRNMIDDDVWVDGVARRIAHARSAGLPVVVTGIRYANELRLIRRLDGHTIWVERPSLRHALDRHPTLDTHSSETSLDHHSFDHVVVNDGTLADLHIKARETVEQIRKGDRP